MEASDALIEIEQMKNEEDQDKVMLEKVHDYYEKNQGKVEKLSEIAEEAYQDWQLTDGMKPWVKDLIWTIIISSCVSLYILKKKKMYCFKPKVEDLDDDNYYNQAQM